MTIDREKEGEIEIRVLTNKNKVRKIFLIMYVTVKIYSSKTEISQNLV